ncbi:MAG: DegV family protein [Oscillospiraceae bacterium]|nr:DegV family protein [Oscillospiraceae bacterium]
MGKIYITADSSVDLTNEILNKYKIQTRPFIVTIGGTSYEDGITINPQKLYEEVKKTNSLPKTAAINVAAYEEFFKNLVADGSEVIHFNISSGFSSSYQNAAIAAEDIEGVYPIDSLNLSTGTALLALKACELVKEGKTAKEIVGIINGLRDKVEASFVVDTLDYLYKGGRCSALSALGANLLKLRPCIEVKDGKMGVGKKYRGKIEDCFYSYVKDRLDGRDDLDLSRIFITNSGNVSDETVNEIEKLILERAPFAEVLKTTAGCTISSHCGPGTLGILFIRK